jgi:hypothetical protein
MTEQPTQQLRTFPWKPVEDAPTIYANISHVGWTIDDLRITLGTLRSATVNGNDDYEVVEEGSVVLPWRQVKNLASTLSRVVSDYEERNGEIITPFLANPEK